MVLNLFLALLLNSFNSEELKSRKEVRKNYCTAFMKRKKVNTLIQHNLMDQSFGFDNIYLNLFDTSKIFEGKSFLTNIFHV